MFKDDYFSGVDFAPLSLLENRIMEKISGLESNTSELDLNEMLEIVTRHECGYSFSAEISSVRSYFLTSINKHDQVRHFTVLPSNDDSKINMYYFSGKRNGDFGELLFLENKYYNLDFFHSSKYNQAWNAGEYSIVGLRILFEYHKKLGELFGGQNSTHRSSENKVVIRSRADYNENKFFGVISDFMGI